jgi:hypothetical protein
MIQNMETIPLSLIDEPIEVVFEKVPTYEKCPDCPQAFIWLGKTHTIIAVISERQDNERRGRYANNMAPAHLSMAQRNGSWGVGRYCFCVQVEGGRIFEIYFDRAPKNAGDRKGHWFLKGERVIKP